MAGTEENRGGQRVNPWRIAAWSVPVIILVLPLVAMQFTDEVAWTLFDFVFAGVLLFGIGFIFELVVRRMDNLAYRAGAGLALAAALLIVWITGAVGIIGNEDHPANLLYFGVLAVGMIGALIARFQADGMARAMFATAFVHALVGVIALAAGWGTTGPIWPLDILGLTGFFVAMFAGSALLFRKAAHGGNDRNAVSPTAHG